MIGQSFAPLGNDPTQRPSGPGGAGGGTTQEAIKILNLRMPRVQGAAAPAPAALLNSPGSGGLPQQQGMNPILDAILRAVLGGFGGPQQSAPSAMGGMVPGGGMPGGGMGGGAPLPNPAVHYQPPPMSGGTAGPNPGGGGMTREDRGNQRGKTGMDHFV